MIERSKYLKQLQIATTRSPITAILGPRQCGKTTLARMFCRGRKAIFFDLESEIDQRRLQNPELVLGTLEGLVVLDEIQTIPCLFNVLRVLVDRPGSQTRFLILGSASPALMKNVSESLAGRVEFLELSGFDLLEVGWDRMKNLWLRGGFPRAFLADSDNDSMAWREGFIRTFLDRDIPQLGFNIPSSALRRFWTMLAHYHGQIWNASELSRSMGLSDKTVRSYLDILTGTFMVRQLQPWYEDLSKRQVKAPKIYFRDSGVLHTLLNISDHHSLLGHPKIGASWEGFVIEQLFQTIQPPEAFFWRTHAGAKIDFFFLHKGKRFAIEIKFSEAPKITRSMIGALSDLKLEHLWVMYPGDHTYKVHEDVTIYPVKDIAEFPQQI
jgi:predicted AAA+ superfamily ATPase